MPCLSTAGYRSARKRPSPSFDPLLSVDNLLETGKVCLSRTREHLVVATSQSLTGVTTMRLYTSVNHDGHYAVPVASIVLAPNEIIARKILGAALVARGLSGEDFTLKEVATHTSQAVILSDGDY